MDRREQMSHALSTPNQSENSHEKQAESGTRILSLLEQCRAEMQQAEQRLAEFQTQFEVTQARFQALQAEITKQYAPPSPTNATFPSRVDSSEETSAADAVYPTYGLYAYGFVKKSSPHIDIVGIDKKHKVYPVQGNGLYVMVSEINISEFQDQVKNLYAALTQTSGTLQNQDGAILQAHENVIDAIMQYTTIVPLKFGTILKDEQAALQLLEEQGEHFKSLLTKFQGKVECGLKVYVDKRVVLQHMMQRDPELTNPQEQPEPRSKGTAYLFARKKEEQFKEHVNNELLRIAEHIFNTFGQTAFDMKQNSLLPQKTTGKKKEMILNAVYLVGQEQVATFYEQAKSITEQYAPIELELDFSGPWPPYNFM